MRYWPTLILGLLLCGSAAAIDVIEFRNPAEEERFRELTAELRCLVCQNQSLDDSTAPLAADLRREVLGLMRDGKNNDEIRTWMVDRYGDFVLYRPRFTAGTLLLWAGPILILAAGVLLLFRSLRRIQAAGESGADDDSPAQ